MRQITGTIIAALLLLPAAGQGAESTSASAPITSIAIISRPTTNYPPDEDREALVYIQFVVGPDGKPTDIALMEDRGFYTPVFAEEALRVVRGTRFRPATQNGVPVASRPMVQPVNFSFAMDREEQGITPAFLTELNKIAKFAESGDIPGAHQHAESMLREKVRFGFEFAVLHAQLARTHAAVGNIDDALRSAERATSRTSMQSQPFAVRGPPPPNNPASYLLPKEMVTALIELRMRLAARRGSAKAALVAYYELAGLTELKADNPLVQMANRIISLMESGTPLGIEGAVGQESWRHDLFHDAFTIQDMKGRIAGITLWCGDGKHRPLTGTTGQLWRTPEGAAACSVEVTGDPGTSFQLVEMPGSSVPAAATP